MLNENNKSIWDSFTNVFSISKTLRFELRLVNDKGELLKSNKAVEALKDIIEKDKKIAKAYEALKPILDKLHEQVINASLNSKEAKKINFNEYYGEYQLADTKNELKNEIKRLRKDLKKSIQNIEILKQKENELNVIIDNKNIKKIEQSLRKEIGKTFNIGISSIIFNKTNEEAKQSNFKNSDLDILFEAQILNYIEKDIENLVRSVYKDLNSEDLIKKIREYIDGEDAYFKIFKGFYTYFGGYNLNRKNYYTTDKEKSTAIATRIVNVNLPKFCSNSVQFEKQKSMYINAHKFLKEKGKTTQIKDVESDKLIDTYSIEKKIFLIENFSNCLSQEEIKEYNRTIGHYNLLINLYNQALGKDKDVKKEILKPFKELYKQIGCGEKKSLFDTLKYDTIVEQKEKEPDAKLIFNLEETLSKVLKAGIKYFNLNSIINKTETNLGSLINWLEKNKDWEDVYWSKATVRKISNSYLVNFDAIEEKLTSIFQGKDKIEKDKYSIIASFDNKREENFKFKDVVQLSVLFEVLDQVKDDDKYNWKNNFIKESILNDKEKIEVIDDNLSPSENLIKLICYDIKKLSKDFLNPENKIIELIEKEEEIFKEILNKTEDNKKRINEQLENLSKIKNSIKTTEEIIKISSIEKFKGKEIYIRIIKQWLDTSLGIIRIIKYFNVPDGKIKKITGGSLNPELSNIIDNLLLPEIDKDVKYNWSNGYDLVRNYLTKKPQEDAKENKIQLNFRNPILLGGWSDGEEKNKGSVIIKKSDEYFVGILIKRNIFDTGKEGNPIYQAPTENAGRLILKNITSKTVLGKGFVSYYGEKYKDMSKKNDIEAIKKAQKFICDYKMKKGNKAYLEKYPKLDSIVNKKYSDKSEFHNDLDQILKDSYECEFTPINWNELLTNIEKKNLYLFQIYSKDFSKNRGVKSKNSIPNLQTLYFENIFKENSNIQLQANAKIFFRNKVEFDKITIHNTPYPIKRRTDGDAASVFKHDIIKDKRFTEEKIQFHFPVSLNYDNTQVTGSEPKHYIEPVNKLINSTFLNEDVQFLGIDRGEKHLLYYSLIDSNGKIKQQGSLNKIKQQGTLNKIIDKDYYASLEGRADERKKQKLEWLAQDKIAPIKQGYISLVVHEIIQKMKDKNGNLKPTFLVLEGLNQGFKRGRQKFEKNVYQQFELALAKKLNYYVDKRAKLDEPASLSKALQLTPPVKNFGDMENSKQFGIMLYTRANYTSITDPVTGWYKTIYLKKGKEENIKKQIFEGFEDIKMDSNGDYFFEYEDKLGKKWKLWSSKNKVELDRYINKMNKKGIYEAELIKIKDLLDKLFNGFDKSKSLKEQLENEGKELNKIKDSNKSAWETLRYAIDLIQKIRNSDNDINSNNDNFLLSPIRDDNGEHFDSRKSNIKDTEIPTNADANGAYNIARKGIIMYEHLKKSKDFNGNINLFISDEEWSLWLNNRDEWNNRLPEFVQRKKM